jgi:hypothetical protein
LRKPVKAAVAHAHDQVARSRRSKQKSEQFIGIPEEMRLLLPLADIVYKPHGVKPLMFVNRVHRGRLLDADDVGCGKCARVEVLKHISPAGVAPGFKSGYKAPLRMKKLQTQERFVNGGRMMGEIVHHENSCKLTYDVLAPLHSIESRNRPPDALRIHSGNAGGRDCGSEVPDIVPSSEPGPE